MGKQIKKMKTNQSEADDERRTWGWRRAGECGEQETQTWPQYTTIYNLNQMQLNDQRRRHKSPASWAADGHADMDMDSDTDTDRATESDVDNAEQQQQQQHVPASGE